MIHEARLFFTALQFLTRLPVPRWVGHEPAWLNQSARYFPAIGTIVGAVSALVLVASERVFGMPVAVGLAMSASVLITGAFHEDGWADTCDALGGAVDRDRALAIMKDSRIGAYGAVGLVLMLGLKAATLAAMPAAEAACSLLFAHTVSRAAAVALIRWLPYAGDVAHAKAKPMAQQISTGALAVAVLWVAGVALILVAADATHARAVMLGMALAIVGAAWCAYRLMQRLGGYTGDALGATQQVTELLVLLGWLGIARSA